jgi:organic hydroperoxide reductase OsmC/OhrA
MDPGQKHAGMTVYSLSKYHSDQKPAYHTTQAHHLCVYSRYLRQDFSIKLTA